ncbi:MAG: hypothetical protein P1V20_15275 [Verrucomicrobiales bacterium]|nr:hypothetical protein [Verrucomicrobiales bacterium]
MGRFIFFIGLFLSIFSANSQEVDQPDPYEWVIESYQFPDNQLTYGFASPERGALVAPSLPANNAPEKEIEEFIRKSSSIVSHYLEIEGLALPKGSLVIFDPESLTLAARLPRIAQSSVAFTSEIRLDAIERYIGTYHSIYEAPSAMMRSIISRASENYDHTELVRELDKAVAENKARIVSTSQVESRSGNRTAIDSSGETATPVELAVDSDSQIEFETEAIESGTSLSIDPVLASDNVTIDFNLTIVHPYTPPVRRTVPFTLRGETILSSTVTDSTDSKISSVYTSRNGAAKMLAVWKPEQSPDPRAQDVLQAGFITNHVVKVLPLLNSNLGPMLEKHGAKVLPIPEGKLEFTKAADEIPEGMIVRRYTIPPTFLSGGGGGGAAASDPFAAAPSNEPRFTVRVTAKDILQSVGIQFPQGSSANYLTATSTLVVRNTPEQIQLVEAYIMSIKSGGVKAVDITLHIVEGPGRLLRETSRKTRRIANHAKVWEELIKSPEISIRTTNWIEARSGSRAKVEAGLNYRFPTGADILAKPENEKQNRDTATSGIFDEQRVGTVFEVDPVIGADNTTIDLNFSVKHDYALPTVTNLSKITPQAVKLDGPTTTFHRASITTQTTLRSGMYRMACMWQPGGIPKYDNADILHAVFIRAEIVELSQESEDNF